MERKSEFLVFRDLTPVVRNGPTKSVYATYASVPAYPSAYVNAFSVKIYKDGGSHGSLNLERLLSSDNYERVPVESGTHGTVSSVACNRYDECSAQYIKSY